MALLLTTCLAGGCAQWRNLDWSPVQPDVDASRDTLPGVTLQVSKASLVTPSSWDGRDQYAPMSGAEAEQMREGIIADLKTSRVFDDVTRRERELTLEVQVSLQARAHGSAYFFSALQGVSLFSLSLVGVPWGAATLKSDALFILRLEGDDDPVWERSFRSEATKVGSLYYGWGLRARPWDESFGDVMAQFKRTVAAERQDILAELSSRGSRPADSSQ